jgi:ABC-type transport system involved in cytochrome bd biosynthesis fused ATPase/permease subunit
MEIIGDYIDLIIMYLPEIDILGITVITLSVLLVVVLALRYEKRRKKMRELKRQRKMLTAKLDELVGGRKKLRF